MYQNKKEKGEYGKQEKGKQDKSPLLDSMDLKSGNLEGLIKKDGTAYKLAHEFGRDINATQIRKIFNFLKQLENEYKSDKDFSKLYSKLVTLDAKVYYGMGRKAQGRPLIPQKFGEIIIRGRNQITVNSPDLFDKFMRFFESFVAYHKYFSEVRSDKR